ncbi:MAG: hypothetical protein HYY25_03760 [Candidatus Wallbacteria bacterium]|nr:hypothetical protein [Candidatus Wallbacteria bacterium]
MTTRNTDDILSRVTDWHRFSVDLAAYLASSGHVELARAVESGASEALMALVRAGEGSRSSQ